MFRYKPVNWISTSHHRTDPVQVQVPVLAPGIVITVEHIVSLYYILTLSLSIVVI